MEQPKINPQPVAEAVTDQKEETVELPSSDIQDEQEKEIKQPEPVGSLSSMLAIKS